MKSLSFLKQRRSLVALCLLVICASMASGLVSTRAQDPASGPALGDTIDLLSFRTQKGETLAQAIKGYSLAMIVLVNPNCQTCTMSKESLNSLKDRVGKPGIPYFVLMIPDSSETEKYFAYADSLKLDARSFVWANAASKPPFSLVTMAVPSHLMVTNEGLVVNKWPGKVEP